MLDTTTEYFINAEVEAEIRNLLHAHFLPLYGDRVSAYVDGMLSLDHYQGRFDWLFETIGQPETIFASPILISGFSAGSEMLMARRVGFRQVYGVEVDPFLLSTTVSRTQYLGGIFPTLYDGLRLPYADSSFGVVASAHIIEHTTDPFLYLCECLRVLQPGGHLALEFPTRFHRRELHTGLPSLEWLPRLIRNSLLKAFSSRFSPLPSSVKKGYYDILATDLKQISMGKVKQYLKRSDHNYSIVRVHEVFPGVIRTAIRKEVATRGTLQFVGAGR